MWSAFRSIWKASPAMRKPFTSIQSLPGAIRQPSMCKCAAPDALRKWREAIQVRPLVLFVKSGTGYDRLRGLSNLREGRFDERGRDVI